jgi:hypothetical protein
VLLTQPTELPQHWANPFESAGILLKKRTVADPALLLVFGITLTLNTCFLWFLPVPTDGREEVTVHLVNVDIVYSPLDRLRTEADVLNVIGA